MTEEEREVLREALMRVNMCAMQWCRICKYNTEPNADCKIIATNSMRIIADALERKEE